jgi:quercetin dioxygenase-like cupin family protein
MAIDLYQPFTNPITRETFRCISSSEEAYAMEWTLHAGGFVPFEHVHVTQEETFHIQSGEMRTRMNGKDHIIRSGETLVIPPGMKHIAFNDRDQALVCIVEYRPGLDLYRTLQCFAGLTIDRDLYRQGLVNVPKIMYMLRRADARSITRPAFAPQWLFRMGMNVFYLYGSILGWDALYRRYTD